MRRWEGIVGFSQIKSIFPDDITNSIELHSIVEIAAWKAATRMQSSARHQTNDLIVI